MPHIFRFHKGVNNNIYDWAASDRILPGDVREVVDKTNIISASAGSSIPTPLARMFLFKTAFEIMAVQLRDNQLENKSIYSGLVSETLDLLELLYKSGTDVERFRYEKWVFDVNLGKENIQNFFGSQHGHLLLAETFSQIAKQEPFAGKIEITLIYYREANKEILIGGTSPYTFVFTTPNFKRKRKEKGIKEIYGMIANEAIFNNNYKPLYEREESFLSYILSLKNTQGISASFNSGFSEYVTNCVNRFPSKFNGVLPKLRDIYFNDLSLSVMNIPLRQLSEEDYKSKISQFSDFKIDFPFNSHYSKEDFPPLFLYSHMDLDGHYTSPSNHWSNKTLISALAYPETTIEEIQNRELPGIRGIRYPFLSKFDIFERSLVKLPSYLLNDEKFETLIENQDFILPIKPLFFFLFPLKNIRDYIQVSRQSRGVGSAAEIVIKVMIPIHGPTFGKRKIVLSQTYKDSPTASKEDEGKYPFIEYKGILGIFPFTKSKIDTLKFTNKYFVSSYEKTNAGERLVKILFFKDDGIKSIPAQPVPRSHYEEVNTSSTYYEVKESFDIIQLGFNSNNAIQSGLIIPKFKEIIEGKAEYVYSIDFGTSNTHIEFAQVDEYGKAKDTQPFEINEKSMFMVMLNKPATNREHDGTVEHNDYTAFGDEVDSVKTIVLREFMPFQIGSHTGATAQFPFRTAVYESRGIKVAKEPSLFVDANIGFNIERDTLVRNQDYSTDIKWQLESNLNDSLKQNRVKLFFRQLLYMIRAHALSSTNPPADVSRLKITMSYPISMDIDLRTYLERFFRQEMSSVFNIGENELSKRLVEIKESLAPFYYLKKEHAFIQNDNYCNIDVGGGSSDIIVVKKDIYGVLNSYCSSVRFAGKQLWGSVSNDFDPNDNGFLKFYLRQLQHKDRESFNKLSNIITAKSNRTQDLVSYLFNEDEFRFKFSQIFTECKELKIPLLIHYAALLYFVAQFCRINQLDLPKTLSFSGKGSEYIYIIFRSEEHLRRFTKLALNIFSDLPDGGEFKIIRNQNPKVITAKGAAIFGASPLKVTEDDIFGGEEASKGQEFEERITTIEKIFYGFNDTGLENRQLTYFDFNDTGEEYPRIMESCRDFLEKFFGSESLMRGSEQSLNINHLSSYKNFFLKDDPGFDILKEGVLRSSYKLALDEKVKPRKVSDSPFFFAFHTSLIELSKKIADEGLKNMKI